jgi:hypothetical protein
MTRLMHSFPERDFGDLGEEQARRLLQMGMVRPFRPVDTLIERLGAPGGHEWFRKSLSAAPFSTPFPGNTDLSLSGGHVLLSGRVMLNQLVGLKEAAKSQARAPDRDERLTARAAYDLAIAAALAHHGRVITGQKRSELMLALTDLADALPEPWAGLAHKACEALAVIK